MLRSLNSGTSGLLSHQTRMDVIGNNISNVNTVGYKGSRATFSESFSQLVKGATRSDSKAGGTNPTQIGLGSSIGSVDTIFTQGSLQNTGRLFDIGIEGNAFFGVSDGTGTYYTRAGAFQLDSEGYIILPTNGMVLQGKMADSMGSFPPGTAISNLQVPLNQQSPAKATSEVSLSRNLNSDGNAKGSVDSTQRLLYPADGARGQMNGITGSERDVHDTKLTSLYNGVGDALNMKDGDILTLSYNLNKAVDSSTYTPDQEIRVTILSGNDRTNVNTTGPDYVANSLEDLRVIIEGFLNVTAPGTTVTLNATTGELEIMGASADIYNFSIFNDGNPISNSETFKAFNFGSYIGPGNAADDENGNTNAATSGVMYRPVDQYDILDYVRNSTGESMNLVDGARISITGSVGEDEISSNPLIFRDANNINGPTLVDDLITQLRNDLQLPISQVGKDNIYYPSVGIKTNDIGEDNIPEGALVIRGLPGSNFSINNLVIQAQNPGGTTISPNNFLQAVGITRISDAQDVEIVDTSIAVYDESGAEHILRITFMHTGQNGVWKWEASFSGKEIITPATSGSGTVTFGADGTVSSWLFDNGGSTLIVEPANGSKTMRIKLDVGGPGNFKGITQFEAQSSVVATAQDGYTTGQLQELSIDEFGLIEGIFSNGTTRKIAQIMVVDFANPSGLLNASDNVYSVSANSGDPVWGSPLTHSSSKLRPGALEMSNVDIAEEFTTMITTQRGYQANSRIITVSDTLLEETVNLKR